MADPDRRRNPPLIERLRAEPYRFDVRQAIRILEHLDPSAAPLATGSDPRREAVRLRGSLTSSFPPSDIESLTLPDGRAKPELTAAFMSLGGAFGPLPPPLTARIIERLRHRDAAARDFLDLFNHRLLSLMLRQWRLLHPALQGDPADPAMPARLPLLALLGLATLPRDPPASVEARLGSLTTGLFGAAGLLNPRPVSAHALERLLAARFDAPVRILPFRGAWAALDPVQWTRLGRFGQRLGQDAVLGTRVWDQAAGITAAIGPIGLRLFTALLPGGPAHDQAARLLMLPLGRRFDLSLKLSLKPAAVPPAKLAAGTRLGWTSWLGTRPRDTPGIATLRLAAPA